MNTEHCEECGADIRPDTKSGISDQHAESCSLHPDAVIGETTTHPPSWWKTIDGVSIVDDLRVWDYDLRRATVDVTGTAWAHSSSEFHAYWEGWFEMRSLDGGRSSTMNGARMWARHPRTGEPA